MKIWKQKSQEEIKAVAFNALNQNVSYLEKPVLGVPGSFLDTKVFNKDAPFLKEAPFLSALLENPNHIGCHTLEKSEPFFSGTQQIEKELLDICAVDILKAELGSFDGYVASGGTEANIQAIWIYRNYFKKNFGARIDEIAILCSKDSHYSMDKAANLLSLDILKVKVDEENRKLDKSALEQVLESAKVSGKTYFIVVCNMMTTMFGSVDDVHMLSTMLKEKQLEFKIHIDGAYGGFYYPFSHAKSVLSFENPNITSFTLDAHKMAQAPYGTGIFLIRKDFIHYAQTKEASYVEGDDFTLIGSRSGANAIAVWMILAKHGPQGWLEKVQKLQDRTEWLTQKLTELDVTYFRNPYANIVTIRSEYMSKELAKKYWLVADNHSHVNFYKVVIMEHVTENILAQFVRDLKNSRSSKLKI